MRHGQTLDFRRVVIGGDFNSSPKLCTSHSTTKEKKLRCKESVEFKISKKNNSGRDNRDVLSLEILATWKHTTVMADHECRALGSQADDTPRDQAGTLYYGYCKAIENSRLLCSHCVRASLRSRLSTRSALYPTTCLSPRHTPLQVSSGFNDSPSPEKKCCFYSHAMSATAIDVHLSFENYYVAPCGF